MKYVSTTPGEDTEMAWSDRHLQHCYLWLTSSPSSPYKGSPTMMFAAMGIEKVYWSDFKKNLAKGDFHWYRFSVRLRMTQNFKNIIAGIFEPIVLKRNVKGVITKWVIKRAINPQPLPCPQFYTGGIKITTRGLKLTMQSTDATLASRYDPEGLRRLTKAFG